MRIMLATLLLAMGIPAAAAELSANAGIVSDYRYRGISLSDRDPAAQGGLDLSMDVGFYAGAWASTIADYGGADVELDLYAGHAGSMAGIKYSIGAYGYFYPGGRGVDYVEFQASFERTLGPVTASAELAYTPDQKNVAVDNLYAGAGMEIPLFALPVSLKLRGGYEDGFYEGKWDWEAGLGYELGPASLSLSYVDTDQPGSDARAGIVLGALLSF